RGLVHVEATAACPSTSGTTEPGAVLETSVGSPAVDALTPTDAWLPLAPDAPLTPTTAVEDRCREVAADLLLLPDDFAKVAVLAPAQNPPTWAAVAVVADLEPAVETAEAVADPEPTVEPAAKVSSAPLVTVGAAVAAR
ncbi:MAG: hypothetical protein ACKPKO_65195, partial [Candidatus Fonsibacter sp.]